jgi:MFS family permease
VRRRANSLLDTKARRSENFIVISTPQTPERKGDSVTTSTSPSPTVQTITLYHWLVVILASAGWLFDCMGQRIFVLGREPAMRELLGAGATDDKVWLWGTLATTALMVGWGTGGLIFGMISDRWGRVKAMIMTLMGYTVFSAVSGFSHSVVDFLIYRFLFGLGVGGMFGAATTLVAESVPARFRTAALGSMQALSACGNMTASALSLRIIPGAENFWGHFSGWQVLFFAGVFPVILAVPMALILKEPEPWRRAKAEAAAGTGGKRVGSIADLFNHPRWRHNTFIGICFGISGMVGLWGIAFFSPELITTAFKNRPLQADEILKPAQLCVALSAPTNAAVSRIKEKLSPGVAKDLSSIKADQEVPVAVQDALRADLNRIIQEDKIYDTEAFKDLNLKKTTSNLVEVVAKKNERTDVVLLNRHLVEQALPGTIKELQKTIGQYKGRGTLLQDVGALIGMFAFTFVAAYFNRRIAFLCSFVLCLFSVAFVFYSLKSEADIYWMYPLLGFATLTPFAGYSIYFPEIFPTRLRGTGVGFCYNTVRYLAAPFPLLLGWLSTQMPFRRVAMIMACIYLVGIVALIWAPETKGKPLPED